MRCEIKDPLGAVEVKEKAKTFLDKALHLASMWKEEGKGDSELVINLVYNK